MEGNDGMVESAGGEKERDGSPRIERGMTVAEYWDRLSRSFNADYMKKVEEKYDSRKRLQMA